MNRHQVVECEKVVMKEHCYWPVVSDLINLLSHQAVSHSFLTQPTLRSMWMNLLTGLQGKLSFLLASLRIGWWGGGGNLSFLTSLGLDGWEDWGGGGGQGELSFLLASGLGGGRCLSTWLFSGWMGVGGGYLSSWPLSGWMVGGGGGASVASGAIFLNC